MLRSRFCIALAPAFLSLKFSWFTSGEPFTAFKVFRKGLAVVLHLEKKKAYQKFLCAVTRQSLSARSGVGEFCFLLWIPSALHLNASWMRGLLRRILSVWNIYVFLLPSLHNWNQLCLAYMLVISIVLRCDSAYVSLLARWRTSGLSEICPNTRLFR